jgi:hypothetical protein
LSDDALVTLLAFALDRLDTYITGHALWTDPALPAALDELRVALGAALGRD